MKLKKCISAFITMLIFSLLLNVTGCKGKNEYEYVGGYDENRTYITASAISSVTSERQNLQTLVKAFEESQDEIGVRISYISDYSTGMMNYITNKNMPDVIWTAGDLHSPYSSIAKPYFENLSSWIENDPDVSLDDLQSVSVQSTHCNQKDTGVWFMPRDINKVTVIINKDMFAAAGVEVPSADNWNYDTFIDCCVKLRSAMNGNISPANGIKSSSYPVYTNAGWSVISQTLIKSYGGSLYDTEAVTPTVNSEENLTAYKKIGTMFYNKYFSPASETANLFSTWDAAMAFIVRTDLTSVISANMGNIDFRENPLAATGAGTTGWAMSSGSSLENKELAWEFLKYTISEEGQNVLGATGSCVPVLKSLENSGSWTNYLDSTLNHRAFTSGSEKNFSLNDVYCFHYSKQAGVKVAAEGIINDVAKAEFWIGTPISQNVGNLNAWSLSGNWSNIINSAANYQQKALSNAG